MRSIWFFSPPETEQSEIVKQPEFIGRAIVMWLRQAPFSL